MKNFIEMIIGGVMVVVVAGGIALAIMAAMLKSTVGALALAFATVLILAMCGTLAVVVGIWLWDWVKRSTTEHAQAAEFIRPDEHGRLPVSVAAMRHPEFILQVLDTYKQSYLQNVTTYHNRPTSTITGADPAALQIAVQNTPQSFAQLYHAGQLPEHGFLMGYDTTTNEPVHADWKRLYSALIGGQSGSGKSTLIRSILAQAALQGGKFVVLDPHYGAGDESLGASLKPLRSRMMGNVAHDDKSMGDALKMIQRIGQRRIAGTDASHDPIILVVDETTALLQRSAVAGLLSDVLGQISQETRKVGLYALCIGQNFDGRVMDTTVRNSFVSFICTRSRRDVARTMTANAEFGKLAADLAIGQAVWMTPGGDVHTLNVPNTTAHDLNLVAGRGFTVVSSESAPTTGNVALPRDFPRTSQALPDSNYYEPEALESGSGSAPEALAPDAESMRNLIKLGYSQKEIIKELWGIDGGRKYNEAVERYTAILSTLV